MSARGLIAPLLVVLSLGASSATAQEPDLRQLAQRAWDANLAAYEVGEVRLLAAYRFSQELFHAEPEPSLTGFHARLSALEALADRRPEPARALDLQTIASVRALVASQEEPGPCAEGATTIAAIGSLLATHREQVEAGEGAPDEYFAWSEALRSVERRQAVPPREVGKFVFDEADAPVTPWDRAHHERQVWLTTTLRAQGRGTGAEFYELSAAPADDERRNESIAEVGLEAVWSKFRDGGVDALAVETWSRRVVDRLGGMQTLEGLQAGEREHLARMRALGEDARARPDDGAGARLRLETALFVARALQPR